MPNLLALSKEQTEEIKQAELYLNAATDFAIVDDQTYSEASTILAKLKEKKKTYDDMRKQLKAPILQAGKQIEELFRGPIHCLTKAEETYKLGMIKYKNQVEQQKRAEEIARQDKIDTLNKEAALALAENDTEVYNLVMEELDNSQNQLTTVPKIEGISYRDNWKAEGVNLALALKGVYEGEAPLSILKFDEVALNQLAKSTKGTVTYPGVNIYKEQIVASRRG